MKFVLAPDSFKECMTAPEAVEAMTAGIHQVYPNAHCVGLPMADGGEGTMDCLVRSTQGRVMECQVTGPTGEPVAAAYGVLGDEKTVVIEVACCCGLPLIADEKRDPAATTSYGVGELIRRALDDGWRRFVMGLGGSGTNDGGAGMLTALGARFMDNKGEILPPGGGALERLAVADFSSLDSRLTEATFDIASDVVNPLTGETGASCVFGPQKGASPEKALWLDNCLKR